MCPAPDWASASPIWSLLLSYEIWHKWYLHWAERARLSDSVNFSKVTQLKKNKVEIQTLDSLVLELSWFIFLFILILDLHGFTFIILTMEMFKDTKKVKESIYNEAPSPPWYSFNNYQHPAILFCLSLPLQHFFPLENFKTNTRRGISSINCWMNICRALIPHHHLTSLWHFHQGPWTIKRLGFTLSIKGKWTGRGKSDLGLNPKPCHCVLCRLSDHLNSPSVKRRWQFRTSLTC